MAQWTILDDGEQLLCARIRDTYGRLHKKERPVLITIMGIPGSGKTYLGERVVRAFSDLRIKHVEATCAASAEELGLLTLRDEAYDGIIYSALSETRFSEDMARRVQARGDFSFHVRAAFGREPDIHVYIARSTKIPPRDHVAITKGHYDLLILNPGA